ncbi:hypothetical protein SLEP1_g52616 [Rubroshorea leprosula]|uniref:Uncharacterized protein n=1 Tax=Rubroshorea leprosula TaxID=152421 RepID=A0AAV5MA90_9ROSI|nr:hypothetical protein SLEP1_g52616 [Rubroshorea leprosula]
MYRKRCFPVDATMQGFIFQPSLPRDVQLSSKDDLQFMEKEQDPRYQMITHLTQLTEMEKST